MACWGFATQKDGVSDPRAPAGAGHRFLPGRLGGVAPSGLAARAAGPGPWRWMSPSLAARSRGWPGEGQAAPGRHCRRAPRGFGRCRMAAPADASTKSPRALLVDHVEPGSTLVTDGWQPHRGAAAGLYTHERLIVPELEAGHLLPVVHRLASSPSGGCSAPAQGEWTRLSWRAIAMRSGSASTAAEPGVRGSSSTGSLITAAHEPVRYRDLIMKRTPTAGRHRLPGGQGHPPSLGRTPSGHPWRSDWPRTGLAGSALLMVSNWRWPEEMLEASPSRRVS